MKTFMKFYITCATLCLMLSQAIAQPDWNRVNYETSTIFTGYVFINNQPAQERDYIGVFVNGECRMKAEVIFVNDTAFVSSVIHSNGSIEYGEIRYWNSISNEVLILDTNVTISDHGSVKYFPILLKSGESQGEQTAVAPVVNSQFLNVYPSPFTNKLTVESSKPIKFVQIYNSIGGRMIAQEGAGSKKIDIISSALANGLYLVTIEFTDGSSQTKKVFKK